MINIGIDGNEANVERRVGISEYAKELITFFANPALRPPTVKFTVYLKDIPLPDFPLPSEWWRYKIIRPRPLWTQFGLPVNLFTQSPRPDVFFSPTHYAPRFSPIPTVISIMDLSYIHFPQMFRRADLFQLQHWTAYSVKNASRVFTISKASRNDIISVYQIPKEKIVVTYPGIKQKTQISATAQTVRKQYGIKGNYILFVGTLQPRKNIVRLIEAFSKIHTKDVQLVIVGKAGWLYQEIFEAPEKFSVSDKVTFLQFVTDSDLAALYQNALFFILPSLYEGFGLPVLEAMQYGCPVITSNVSSLPEAGGKAALYVDPENVSDIAEKMNLLVSDEKLRKEMIKKGYEHLKKFSWEKTARETLAVLEEVAREGKKQ